VPGCDGGNQLAGGGGISIFAAGFEGDRTDPGRVTKRKGVETDGGAGEGLGFSGLYSASL
jgi:hypothetical protein